MKILFIYNTEAGFGDFVQSLDRIIEAFQKADTSIEFLRINKKTKLFDLLDKRKKEAYEKVVIAGGDGTVHNVINTLEMLNMKCNISIFPIGLANDYAKYFNLPNTIDEMIDIATKDNYTSCDLAKGNEHIFLNIASVGNSILDTKNIDSDLRTSFGKAAYYINAISEIKNMKPIHVDIKSDEKAYFGEALLVLVLNGTSILGLKQASKNYIMNDGELDVIVIKKAHRIELLPLMIKAFNGEFLNNDQVFTFSTKKLSIISDESLIVNFDGETNSSLPMTFEVLPSALQVNTKYNNEGFINNDATFSIHEAKDMMVHFTKAMASSIKNPFGDIEIERNIAKDFVDIVSDLTRHDAFNYINKGAIDSTYFDCASKTLSNGFMYLILSSTGSAAGELIGKVTKKEYSHVSLAFDEDLKTIISYNGGENIYSPGLNKELLEYFYKKNDANIMVYKIKANIDQKQKIFDEIKNINNEGSSYNIIGLLMKYSHRDNIMFCSQFVYKMLEIAGLAYFEKKPEDVKPTDFVEHDYERKLDFVEKIFIKEVVE